MPYLDVSDYYFGCQPNFRFDIDRADIERTHFSILS